jgi:glycine/D-amino acid oxidase-like deaminating enzyme
MESHERFEVAVVGIGLIGSGALRHLATAGVRCVGIGPDEPVDFATHEGAFASHYDSGRITRMIDPRYEWGLLAKRAIAQYPVIEVASGLTFHRPTGLIYTAKHADEFAKLQDTADRLQIPCKVGPAMGDFPDQRLGLSGWNVFVEPGPAGHIDPRIMRIAQLKVAAANGAEIVRQVAVSATPIDPTVGGRSGWRIQLADGSPCLAERVLVAAGPHADEFIAPWGQLAYDVRNEAVITAALDDDEQSRLAGLPSVIADVEDESTDSVYMVPPTTYPDGSVRIKLGAELFTWRTLATAEDRRQWMRGDEHLQQFPHLKRLLENLVPGLRSDSWVSKPCLIPHTPSMLPYVEHLDEGLAVAAGCNGWAGKSADAIGELAAGLVREGRWIDPDLAESDFRAHFTSSTAQ